MLQRDELLKLLSGDGIEIGALHRPCEAAHLRVKYVDRLSREQALEHYPELKNEKLVEVDIIDDAESLATLQAESQDFVIANHVIEHMANPVKSLLNWGRVLRPAGRLYLAVPDKHYTFDKQRPKTSIEHLMLDYHSPSAERDREHFLEFATEVSCKTFNVRPIEQAALFADELWNMAYSIHFHVWDYGSFYEFLQFLSENMPNWQLDIMAKRKTLGEEFIFVLQKR